MRIVLSAYVEGDLDEIATYIAVDNPSRAVSFIDEITGRFQKIGDTPRAYRLRPEIRPDVRLAAHGHYVILFRIMDETLRIERVVHGSRSLVGLFSSETYKGVA